jgi:hypothetical protein
VLRLTLCYAGGAFQDPQPLIHIDFLQEEHQYFLDIMIEVEEFWDDKTPLHIILVIFHKNLSWKE